MKITRRQLRQLIREAMGQVQNLEKDQAKRARAAASRISPRPRGRFEATMSVDEEGRATVEVDDSTSIGDEASQVIVNGLKLDGRVGQRKGSLKPGVAYKFVAVFG